MIPNVHRPEIEDRADPWTPGSSSCLGRDAGPPSTRNTSKGALVHEAQAVFRAIGRGTAVADLRRACLEGELLRKATRETRST